MGHTVSTTKELQNSFFYFFYLVELTEGEYEYKWRGRGGVVLTNSITPLNIVGDP